LLSPNTNPALVEGSVDVAVPYDWVNAGLAISLFSLTFPGKVATRKTRELIKPKKKHKRDQKID